MSEWVCFCVCLFWLVGYLGSDSKEEDWLTWLFFYFCWLCCCCCCCWNGERETKLEVTLHILSLFYVFFLPQERFSLSLSFLSVLSFLCNICPFSSRFFPLSLSLSLYIYRYFLVFSRWASVEVCTMIEAAWAWVRVFFFFFLFLLYVSFKFDFFVQRERVWEREKESVL